MKQYVLILARTFPKGHPRAGEPTGFKETFLNGIKLHTFRSNPIKWMRILREVAFHEAILSVREWSGEPYRSEQRVIKNLSYEDKLDYEVINMSLVGQCLSRDYKRLIANNDGMELEDWEAWFKKDLNSMAPTWRILIYFTNDLKYNITDG